MNIILLSLLGVIGFVLFLKYRPKSYESILIDKEEAINISTRHIKKLTNIDVSDWQPYCMYWYDRETVNRLHNLNMLNRLRTTLYKWGIIESWRIRFVSQNKSISIGINADKEIVFMHVDVRSQEMGTNEINIQSPLDVIKALTVNNSGIWSKVKSTGEGERKEDFSNIRTYWYILEEEELRMKISIQVQENVIIGILSDTEILTSNMGEIVKKEFGESALNLSGFIGSFIATIIGILLLIFTDNEVYLKTPIIITLFTIVGVLLTCKEDISMGIINSFDSRLSVKSVYLIGIISAIMGSIAYGCVTFITSLTGINLATVLELPLFENVGMQVLTGVLISFISLGLFSSIFHYMDKNNLIRISPELSDRSSYLSGFKLKQSLSISLQSSVTEEVIFRLLGISTLLWLFNNNLLAVTITSVLWSLLHQGSGYNPRFIRWIQLVLFGFILGFTYLYYGFLAALITHFVHNFIVLSIPLIYYKIQMKAGKVENTHNIQY
ncbi:CPBP family intramembrane glutamic endopeptidase [Peribacillus frigoritolerans]|uniref:CPBP family intramembrane glutamic endopeptidase n=1 Tax=Peribacillus frigoritolerans TaxID=450367 RepID=UPI0035CE8647